MLWMHGSRSGKGLICPTCQIPVEYVDGKEGQFLQAWDSGFAGGTLRVQEYEPIEESKDYSTDKERRLVQIPPLTSHCDKPSQLSRTQPSRDANRSAITPPKHVRRAVSATMDSGGMLC